MGSRHLLTLLLCGSCCAQNYTLEKSNTTENLRGVSVVSSAIAWASGTHGTYLRTTDGGASWNSAQVPGAEALDIRDVEAFSASEAYLLSAGPGELSRIYKTTDGGRNWTLQFTNPDAKGFFDCMAFWDSKHGVALGDPVEGRFVLITTKDGGKNWKRLASQPMPPAIAGEGAFAASGTCIAVQRKNNIWFATGGSVARVFRSADRGKSWSVAETPIVHGNESSGIFSIAFRDVLHGVIAGGDYKQPAQEGPNLAFTDDGGRTWQLSKASPQASFSAVAFDGASGRVLAVGPVLTLAVENGSGRKISDLSLNALSVSKTAQAVAVGPKGTVARFSNGK
jgi:photosystem II stability/assembly factor-like uncharacterized protein